MSLRTKTRLFLYPGTQRPTCTANTKKLQRMLALESLVFFSVQSSRNGISLYSSQGKINAMYVLLQSMETLIKLCLHINLEQRKQVTRRQLMTSYMCGQWTCRQCPFVQKQRPVQSITKPNCKFCKCYSH